VSANRDPGPVKCETTGRAYELVGCFDSWPSTFTTHLCSLPAPSVVTQASATCGSETLHDAAYSVPSGPYVASIGVPAGPKFAPRISTASPPRVDPAAAPGPASRSTTGAPYDVFDDSRMFECLFPSWTCQTRSRPVPSPVRQLM
jgi:hypothetical protein